MTPEAFVRKWSGVALTSLYNQRPAWLAHAHASLDAAVADAYGFPPDLGEPEILAKLLKRNAETQP